MGRLQILFALAVTLAASQAHALDFDKEIAKQEDVTITLRNSVDKQAPADAKQSKCDCAVKLIKKERKLASR